MGGECSHFLVPIHGPQTGIRTEEFVSRYFPNHQLYKLLKFFTLLPTEKATLDFQNKSLTQIEILTHPFLAAFLVQELDPDGVRTEITPEEISELLLTKETTLRYLRSENFNYLSEWVLFGGKSLKHNSQFKAKKGRVNPHPRKDDISNVQKEIEHLFDHQAIDPKNFDLGALVFSPFSKDKQRLLIDLISELDRDSLDELIVSCAENNDPKHMAAVLFQLIETNF